MDHYFIAINGPSCAITAVPFSKPPKTSPRCECLIGFPSLEEARQAHQVCLTAPMEEVMRRMRLWHADPRIIYLVQPNPEPPSREPTFWLG
jgi:hypothetical protein